MEQVESRVSGPEDKVEELGQTGKDAKKIGMEHARHLVHHEKTKSMNHWYRGRRRDTN
jgi:hypothetical protein